MADGAYQAGINAVMTGGFDLDTDTIEALLVSTAYAFDGADEDEADLTGILARVDLTSNAVSATGVLSADSPLTFASVASGSTAKAVILQKKTGVAATATLLAYFDQITNFPRATDDGNIVVALNASGILRIAGAA